MLRHYFSKVTLAFVLVWDVITLSDQHCSASFSPDGNERVFCQNPGNRLYSCTKKSCHYKFGGIDSFHFERCSQRGSDTIYNFIWPTDFYVPDGTQSITINAGQHSSELKGQRINITTSEFIRCFWVNWNDKNALRLDCKGCKLLK
ncbi:hypothetical protein O181_000818 [Austropuccinia psidii MF-1]|uniref:Secreted protein n=1 Tax=Austropuccinia psidii MF-1 TaxID=1389203 RepID=A0A9Q3B996_9BASI|nr:hypothetical protein [Austropuccinia psidii MF-1]